MSIPEKKAENSDKKKGLLKAEESEGQREARITKSVNKWRDLFTSFDQMMKFIFVIYLVLIILMANNAIAIETYFVGKGMSAINFYEFLLIIPGIAISFTIFWLVKWSTKAFILRNQLNHSRIKETQEERLNRVQTFFNTVVYYTLSVSINYYLIMTYSPRYMPRFLNGDLKIETFLSTWGEIPEQPVRVFFMISIGHHIERTYQHVRHNLKGNNFWVMILHHVLTINLMLCCYLNRHFVYGIPVLFIHDIGDIFVGWVKLVREIKQWKHLAVPIFVALILIWIYTRIFIFVTELLYPTFTDLIFQFAPDFLINHLFALLGLLILLVMNCYWAFGIANSGYQKVFKKNGDAIHFEGETVDFESEKKTN